METSPDSLQLASEEIIQKGTFGFAAGTVFYGEINALFRPA
jgi:hypothetical protein